MKKLYFFIILLAVCLFTVKAQLTPEVTSWKINTSGATGYSGILSNVQQVQYSTGNVYISCTGVPAYSIGPWPSNPNVAKNQNFVFKITRNPKANTGTLTKVGLGHTGVWSNGVSIFNSDDGMTYNNEGVWHRNAYFWEGVSFDDCLGHPQQSGEYHHHVNPKCLYNDADSTKHSPIIGYSFDGFPIYGAYGYTNTDGTGAIKRMNSSYKLRNIADRKLLPDGTTASFAGPAINSTYPLGAYIQDYFFSAGSGDLDVHNGRFCVTPEYPKGIYAYFVTINAALDPVFPYTMSETYFGEVQAGNAGPGSGHVTITETVTTYSTAGVESIKNEIPLKMYPNPASSFLTLFVLPGFYNNMKVNVINELGQTLKIQENIQPAIGYAIDLTDLQNGIYYLKLETNTLTTIRKFQVLKK